MGWFMVPLLVLVLTVGWAKYSFISGALLAVVVLIAMRIIGSMFGLPGWYRRRKIIPMITKQVPRPVTENKPIGKHRCCIQCQHPVKDLR